MKRKLLICFLVFAGCMPVKNTPPKSPPPDPWPDQIFGHSAAASFYLKSRLGEPVGTSRDNTIQAFLEKKAIHTKLARRIKITYSEEQYSIYGKAHPILLHNGNVSLLNVILADVHRKTVPEKYSVPHSHISSELYAGKVFLQAYGRDSRRFSREDYKKAGFNSDYEYDDTSGMLCAGRDVFFAFAVKHKTD